MAKVPLPGPRIVCLTVRDHSNCDTPNHGNYNVQKDFHSQIVSKYVQV